MQQTHTHTHCVQYFSYSCHWPCSDRSSLLFGLLSFGVAMLFSDGAGAPRGVSAVLSGGRVKVLNDILYLFYL